MGEETGKNCSSSRTHKLKAKDSQVLTVTVPQSCSKGQADTFQGKGQSGVDCHCSSKLF